MTTTMKISQFEKEKDSVSLKEIDGQQFHIVKVDESNYDEQPGIKITTEEAFQIDGVEWNKFHTTRHAIVAKLNQPEVITQLAQGKIGPCKCEKTKAKTKGVSDYWLLVNA